MEEDVSARHGWPFLVPGQAQKELHHNEALAALDIALAPVVEGEAADPSALSPQPGQCWIVAAGAVGEWQGREGEIAGWTESGWRFARGIEAMRAYDNAAGCLRYFSAGAWLSPPAVADPSGGTQIDAEARQSLSDLLAYLRGCGLIAG